MTAWPIKGLGLIQIAQPWFIMAILGLYWDNGKYTGNYYNNGLYRDYGVQGKSAVERRARGSFLH